MFSVSKLSFRPTKLQVHRDNKPSRQTDVEVDNEIESKQKGYLGTLVVSEEGDNYAAGGTVHVVDKNGEKSTVSGCYNNWYAVAAGGTSTVELLFESNTRLSLQYDIYDATPDHDPLSMFNGDDNFDSDKDVVNNEDDSDDIDDDDDYDDGSNDTDTSEKVLPSLHDSLIPRTTVPEKVKSEVLTAVEAELATSEAVVICLQHVYRHSKEMCRLRGGDAALRTVLASQYDVQPVEVLLQSARDTVTGRNKIVSGTYSANSVGSFDSSTKLIIPITLNSEHQSAENKDVFTVAGLRVTKKK